MVHPLTCDFRPADSPLNDERAEIPVAVLCCSPRSIYRSLPGVECFDRRRDVRTFNGGMRIVAHPPCRSWSAFCAHQAKPEPGEKELGPLCVDWLRKCGGVLEHPAHSRLWDFCGLPKPVWTSRGSLWSIAVNQSLWGDTRSKSTWLCFFGVSPTDIQLPLRLHSPEFATWLVSVARKSKGGAL